MDKRDLPYLCFGAGLLTASGGLALWSLPAGVVFLGLVLMAIPTFGRRA